MKNIFFTFPAKKKKSKPDNKSLNKLIKVQDRKRTR